MGTDKAKNKLSDFHTCFGNDGSNPCKVHIHAKEHDFLMVVKDNANNALQIANQICISLNRDHLFEALVKEIENELGNTIVCLDEDDENYEYNKQKVQRLQMLLKKAKAAV